MAKVVKRGGDFFLSFFSGKLRRPLPGLFWNFHQNTRNCRHRKGGTGFYCRFPSPLSSDDRIFTEGENNRAIKFPLFSFFFEGDLGEKGKQKSEAISRTEKICLLLLFSTFPSKVTGLERNGEGEKGDGAQKVYYLSIATHTPVRGKKEKTVKVVDEILFS